jgi:hypothetical protein
MIKKIAAIIAAAACAGVIVTLVPGFAPEVAAGTSQAVDQSAPSSVTVIRPAEEAVPSAEDIRNAVEQNIRNGSRDRKIVCAQSWPYYDHSCLRDSRKADGNARTVRVIAADRSAAIQPRR